MESKTATKQRLEEPAAVVLRYTVYEGDILRFWTEAERERYHDGHPEAREQFAIQAAEAARGKSGGAPDIEVLVDGATVWSNH